MSWLVYAFIGITIWSATAVADRFFLLKHVTSMRFYVVVPSLVQCAAVCLAALALGIPHVGTLSAAAAIASGVAEVVVLYYLYTAMSSDEVSRVFALTTAGPIITLVLGWLLLHEALSIREVVAFACFLAGGFLLAVRFGQGSFSISRALKPLFFGSLFTSVFTLLLRYAFVSSDFWTGFFWSRIGFFIGGIIVLFLYRTEIAAQWGRLAASTRAVLIGNQVVALSGHAFYFLALSLSSAALVQSVLSAQSAIILVMAAVVAWWRHDLIGESIARHDLLQKGIGVAFVVVASWLLVA
jgi:transporter family protein